MIIFQTIPGLIKLAGVFIYIVVCIRRGISLGTTFLTAALISGLLYGVHIFDILKISAGAVFSPKTISLGMVVTLILLLSNLMEKTGQMESLLGSFKGLIRSSRINLVVFPAIIGLLPMPGGAVFSAPMVKTLGNHQNYSPAKLSFINYWFRHVWEYWWPLYPGIIILPAMTGIGLNKYVVYHFPISIFAILIGSFFLKKGDKRAADVTRPSIREFLWELIPILIAVFSGLFLGALIQKIFPSLSVARELGLILALVLSVFWVVIVKKYPMADVFRLFDSRMLKMAYMMMTILLFKDILEQSRAVDVIANELAMLKIPMILVVALLPFLTGLITGISVAVMGSTFPIIIHMVGTGDSALSLLPYIELAMVCGFAGVLLSPVHLCLIVSNEYFETSMGSVYKILWIACFLLVLSSYLYFYLLKGFIIA